MKLKFLKDTYYGDKLFAREGEIKEVSEELGFAARWVKRGAQIVSEQEIILKEAPPEEVSVEKVEVVEEEKAVDNKSGKKIKGHRVG